MKRNLPVIYDPKNSPQRDLNNFSRQEESMKKGTIPQWLNIGITLLFVVVGGAWYMGKLDSKIEMGFTATKNGLQALTEMQKSNNIKFTQLANGTVALQVKTTETATKITALEKKTEQLENRQYQNRSTKRKRR
jgi:hypothetical protein